jgi:23S rRNA pseudouridine1911/1915/1917 synthase
MELLVEYVDDDVVVVNKPPGMITHQAPSFDGPDVISQLKKQGVEITATSEETTGQGNRRGVVSRLDVGTSGLLVLARTDEAFLHLKRQFMEHTVVKKYCALAEGKFTLRRGLIVAPIGRNPHNRWKYTITEGGKEARTNFDVVAEYYLSAPENAATLLDLRLETGRTHQIRVHLQHYGHALIGERIYKKRRSEIDLFLQLPRPFLHSKFLEFVHPSKNEPISFECALPDDLQSALDRLNQG